MRPCRQFTIAEFWQFPDNRCPFFNNFHENPGHKVASQTYMD